MKVKIEMKENWRMMLSFEFMAAVLSLEQRLALSERLREVSAKFVHAPVNLLSFHEINHMWRTGNGAATNVHWEIGQVRELSYADSALGEPNTTWLVAEVDMHQNPGVFERLSRRACETPPDDKWRVRDDFAVFPRMMVNAIPESQPRIGEQHRRMQFKGYGPILGLDCVYGVQRQEILQSITDANYIKKHQLDLPIKP